VVEKEYIKKKKRGEHVPHSDLSTLVIVVVLVVLVAAFFITFVTYALAGLAIDVGPVFGSFPGARKWFGWGSCGVRALALRRRN
jgi:hypothetical protein